MRGFVVLAFVAACAQANMAQDGIAVSPTMLSVAAGQTGTLTATSEDLVGIVWTTDAPDIATVVGDATATVTGVKPGHATITALVGPVATSVDVTVTEAVVDMIAVTATPSIVPLGTSSQLVAMAHYSDGKTIDATDMVAWTLVDQTLGTIDASGHLTTTAVGTTDAEASLDDVRGMASIKISRAALVSLAIADANPGNIPKGIDHALIANGTFTDGTVEDVSAQVMWTSSKPAVATVAAGVVHAVDVGSAMITAAEDTITATANVGVSAAVLKSLALDHPDSSLALGRGLTVKAIGTYSDNSMQDVSSVAQWTSSSGAATVALGVVTTKTVGMSTISAALDSKAVSLTLTVTPAVVDHVAIVPSGAIKLMQNQKAQLHANLVYSDGTIVDATGGTWTSTTSAATVSAGLVTAGGAGGTGMLTISSGGFNASTPLTVTGVVCHVVINELVTAGSSSSDEWAELYNPCTGSFDLTGWTLDYRAASNATGPDNLMLATLSGTIAPGEFRLYAGAGFVGGVTPDATWGGGASGELQANNGAVGLRSGPKDTGPIVDALAYGAVMTGSPFIEATPATMLTTAVSLKRLFDGDDTNDNAADFAISTTPTPRAAR